MRGARSDFHSRLVAWLKILLPLAALAILSTLFLLSRTIDPEDAIPYAEVDLNELAREPRLTAPEYSGVTDDGSAITVSAGEARPDAANPDKASAQTMHAVLEAKGGVLRTELIAATGSVDTSADTLSLTGGVQLFTSTGYSLNTEHLTSALSRTEISADTAVEAQAPYGTVTSGGMRLEAVAQGEDGTEPQYLLVFNGGVKLIYLPAK